MCHIWGFTLGGTKCYMWELKDAELDLITQLTQATLAAGWSKKPDLPTCSSEPHHYALSTLYLCTVHAIEVLSVITVACVDIWNGTSHITTLY